MPGYQAEMLRYGEFISFPNVARKGKYGITFLEQVGASLELLSSANVIHVPWQ